METEKLCYKGKPIRPEEQSKAWSIYLAILEALIKLDLEKKNWIDKVCIIVLVSDRPFRKNNGAIHLRLALA